MKMGRLSKLSGHHRLTAYTAGELHGEIRFGGQQATRSFLRRHTGAAVPDPISWRTCALVRMCSQSLVRLRAGFHGKARAFAHPAGCTSWCMTDWLFSKAWVVIQYFQIMLWRTCAGYVEQFDTLVDELTVNEMLMYTAELKRSRHEPLAVRLYTAYCLSASGVSTLHVERVSTEQQRCHPSSSSGEIAHIGPPIRSTSGGLQNDMCDRKLALGEHGIVVVMCTS